MRARLGNRYIRCPENRIENLSFQSLYFFSFFFLFFFVPSLPNMLHRSQGRTRKERGDEEKKEKKTS